MEGGGGGLGGSGGPLTRYYGLSLPVETARGGADGGLRIRWTLVVRRRTPTFCILIRLDLIYRCWVTFSDLLFFANPDFK